MSVHSVYQKKTLPLETVPGLKNSQNAFASALPRTLAGWAHSAPPDPVAGLGEGRWSVRRGGDGEGGEREEVCICICVVFCICCILISMRKKTITFVFVTRMVLVRMQQVNLPRLPKPQRQKLPLVHCRRYFQWLCLACGSNVVIWVIYIFSFTHYSFANVCQICHSNNR